MIREVNSTLDPERVADAIVAQAAEWLPAPAWVVLRHRQRRVRTFGARGVTAALEPAASRSGSGSSSTGWSAARRDVAADQPVRRRRQRGGDRLSARVPRPDGRGARRPGQGRRRRASRGWRRRRRRRCSRLLEPGAIALDNALRVQRAEALSVTDDLTQLYNSRYLSQVLRRETKRASRSGRPLSLLFIDLDGFKSINDTHGHLYGSRALVEAAGLIRLSARETDVVARFGGDEFALILPDTGSEGAAAVGERIRERVNAHRFLQGDGLNIHLTVSVGVATLPDVAASTEGLIQAADEAMYHVKDHGKNGIYIAGSGSEERI